MSIASTSSGCNASDQMRAHFLRHVNGRLQTGHTLLGRSDGFTWLQKSLRILTNALTFGVRHPIVSGGIMRMR